MRLPTIEGIIRRRILVNYRVDPQVIQNLLPRRFRPKLQEGQAIAGICLIRLERIRPKMLPDIIGISSENAAHRIAVLWDDDEGEVHEGVFIPRRDTNSSVNHLLGGRVFPGEHHRAKFNVDEQSDRVALSMKSNDGTVAVEIDGRISNDLPPASVFRSLEEASAFFEAGSVGYSVTRDKKRLDGLTLETKEWRVRALQVNKVASSYFADESRFPKASAQFDNALIMKNITHQWHKASDLFV